MEKNKNMQRRNKNLGRRKGWRRRKHIPC